MDIYEMQDVIQQLSSLSKDHYTLNDSSTLSVNVDEVTQVRQQLIGVENIRQALIRYVVRVDPLGIYTDADSLDNGVPILTIEELVIVTVDAILEYEHYMTVNNLL